MRLCIAGLTFSRCGCIFQIGTLYGTLCGTCASVFRTENQIALAWIESV